MEQHAGAHQRYSQALEGLGAVVRDYENDLATAAADAEYWRHEAETFRRKYQEEKARNERLRRVLCLLQAPAAGAPTAGAAAAAAAALPHLLPTARSAGGSLTSAASFTRRATVAAAAAAAAANAQHQELSLALAAGAAPPGALARASHDGAVGRDAHPPPLLPPQGSAPLPGGRAAAVRWPSGLQRSVSTPPRSAGGTPTSAAAAAAAAAARVGSFATSLGGALGAIESPKLRRQTIESLFSMMMAYTVAQGVAAGDAGDGAGGDDGEEPLSSISIDDDEGSSGVGLAAAAAAAAAMARAWARAASREQREASVGVAGSVGGAGGAGGGGAGGAGAGGGKAGFRLVATVTNKMGKRRQSQANLALSNSASQDSLLDTSPYASSSSLAGGAGGGPSPSPLGAAAAAAAANGGGAARPGSAPPRAAGSGGDAGGSVDGTPPAPQQQQQQPTGAAPTSGPSGQGSNIALHWLSRPRNVLVMRKPGCTTEGAFQAAVEWLTERHINVYVEPSVYRDMMQQRKQREMCQDKGQQQQQQQQQQEPEGQGSKEQEQESEGQGSKEQQREPEGQGSKEQEQTAAAQAWTSQQPPRSRPAGSSSGLSVSFAPHGASGASGAAAAGGGRDSSGGGAPDRPPGELRTWDVAPGGAGEYLPEWLSNSLDFVVVFGGDGTVLWTCHMFGNRSVPPVVPFNLGSLGFLTPFDPAALRRVMSRIVRGGFPLQLRHRLHCTLVRSSALPEEPPARAVPRPSSVSGGLGDGGALAYTPPSAAAAGGMPALPAGLAAFAEGNGCPAGVCLESEERVVLNEVVLDRGISPFLTNLETYCDGNFVTNVQGDGLIVATPTGSTAYSLAAGGSMVHPQVPCILFTPICPHSLSFRPLMFPDHVVLCIRVPAGIRSQVWCSFDGKERTELHPGDAVLIRLSKWPLPTVTSASDASTDWFSSVRSNLGWNARKLQAGAGQ